MTDLLSLQVFSTLLEIIKNQNNALQALASGEASFESIQAASVESGKLEKLINEMIDPLQISSLKAELLKL